MSLRSICGGSRAERQLFFSPTAWTRHPSGRAMTARCATEEIDSLFYTIRYDTSRDLGGMGGGMGYPGRRRGGGGQMTIGDILAQVIAAATFQAAVRRAVRRGRICPRETIPRDARAE